MYVSLKRSDWETVTVGLLGDLLKGVSYKKDDAKKSANTGNFPILRANNIVSGTLYFEDLVYVPQRYISDVQFIKRDDIIFCMSSGSKHLVGKSAKAVSDFRGSCGAFCALFRPLELVDPNYLSYFFQGPYYKRIISEISKGTNINNLKREHIVDLVVPLPPLPEQRRIVAKIEELFSELDKGAELLKTMQQQLKVYRHAVLKAAFEGTLTEEWRNNYCSNISNNKLSSKKLYDLPREWTWARLSQIADRIQIGPFGSQLHKYDYQEEGLPIINPKHIQDQNIKPEERISKSKTLELPQYILAKNDIVMGRRGEMGRSAPISDKEEGWICGTGSLFIRLGSNYSSKLYSLMLSTKRVVNYLEQSSRGTTMTNLNLDIMKNLCLPVIPLKEQEIIIQEIESRLSVADKMEETIAQSLQQSEALRQSILKKAFYGRLLSAAELEEVRREPDWEPASVLLQKLKAQKAEADTQKPPVKKSARKGKKQT